MRVCNVNCLQGMYVCVCVCVCVCGGGGAGGAGVGGISKSPPLNSVELVKRRAKPEQF